MKIKRYKKEVCVGPTYLPRWGLWLIMKARGLR